MITVEDFIIQEKEKLKLEKQQLELHIQVCHNIRELKKEHLEESAQDFGSVEKQFLTSNFPVSEVKNGSIMIASNRRTILPVDDAEDFGLPLGNDVERRRQLAEERRKEYNRLLKESNRRTILPVDDAEDFGLPLGNDVERRRQLAEERRKEYNRLLKEKEEKDNFMRIQKTAFARFHKEPKQQMSLDYEQMLRQKKLDENKY
ncbi:centrosome and spindle pole-associated protein 1-like, partial [Limulus polyphemus]|uniref:Centrosome and spindle pole-associated protein 1-like n=1 Tax=Limulus polyphemus TaxID=6850 RepID=A0ABM1TR99_LIMPO